MRNCIKKMVMMYMLAVAMLFGFNIPATAQKASKISAETRLILAERDGKLSLDTPKNLRGKKITKKKNTTDGQEETIDLGSFDEALPVAKPFVRDGVKMASCWIRMKDTNYAALEKLGVKINAKFEGRVTASIPVDVIEKVAALDNVIQVSVAKKLKPNTYRARKLTNADDVISHSSDAVKAGLSQAYDGTGVVLGIIDNGIDFGHIMFKDANGNSRIKKKYVSILGWFMGEYIDETAYYGGSSHGTHTSTIAGGSNYSADFHYYNPVTRKESVERNATFGGMAPGTDLVLCDLSGDLTDNLIGESIQLISDYANSVGKPYVISISLGTKTGPHDGTGDLAEVCSQYTGEGKVIVFSAGNEGEDYLYHTKKATASSPDMMLFNCHSRSEDGYDLGIVQSYARTPNIELAAQYYVIDTSNNTIVWASNEISATEKYTINNGIYGIEMADTIKGLNGNPLSNYFESIEEKSALCCYIEKNPNNKWCVFSKPNYLKPTDEKYYIGMRIYPKSGNSIIDSWGDDIDFTRSCKATYNNTSYTFTEGSNDCSISNQSTFPSVISVGSYCSTKFWLGQDGKFYYYANSKENDISSFSSYQVSGSGPLGTKLPWITAPGEVILAGYNSKSKATDALYAYDTNQELGVMQGTSMAAPCVAGIVALWLQADPTLTPDKVKNVMAQTAIHDQYTDGTIAHMFGNGKIDALAGLKLLEEPPTPIFVNNITLDQTSATLNVGETHQLTATVQPNNATNKTVTWTTSNKNVATVSSTGLVTAVTAGSATITCTANDGSGVRATCTVTVKPNIILVNKITLNQTSVTITDRGTLQLKATVLPENATDKTVTWTTSNKDVATVDSNGKVMAVAAGTVTIICMANDGSDVKATCEVTIKPSVVLVSEIELNFTSITLIVNGNPLQLNATVLPENATDKSVSWKSSNPDVATIETVNKYSCRVKGIAKGNATITCTANDGSGVTATCNVTVETPPEPYPSLYHISVVCQNNNPLQLTYKDELNLTATFGNIGITGDVETVAVIFAKDEDLTVIRWGGSVTNRFEAFQNTTVNNSVRLSSVPVGEYYATVMYWDVEDNTWYYNEVCFVDIKIIPGPETNPFLVSVSCQNSNPLNLTNNDELQLKCTFENNGIAGKGDTRLIIIPENWDGYDKTIVKSGEKISRYFAAPPQSTTLNYSISLADIPEGEYYATVKYYNNGGWWYNTKHFVKIKVEEVSYRRGDVNGDGEVNGTDGVVLVNIILGRSENRPAADVNGDGEVNGTDYVALVNIILGRSYAPSKSFDFNEDTFAGTSYLWIEPFTINAGEEKTMTIDLWNPDDDITLVQYDLRLPKGLYLKMIGDEYDAEITGRTDRESHSLSAHTIDGTTHFLLASHNNSSFTGTDGAIIKMTFVADENYQGGAISLENILLVTPREQETRPGDLTLGIRGIFVNQKTDEPVYNVTGQKLYAPRKGINIINGKKIIVK